MSESALDEDAWYDILVNSLHISSGDSDSPQQALMYDTSACVSLGVRSGVWRVSWLWDEMILTGSTLQTVASKLRILDRCS